jgi:phosphate transport system ATP-binding protein
MIPPDTTSNDRTDLSMTDRPPEPEAATSTPAAPSATPAASEAHSVSLKGLHAYYGQQEAIKGVDLDFEANKVTAMIGPSGCGKSTLVRCINRMHEEIPGARAEGSVMLDELDVYSSGVDVTAVRRLIGMVFQKPNPFPTMSIFDNVSAGLRLTGEKGGNLRERVHRALRSVGLWEEV